MLTALAFGSAQAWSQSAEPSEVVSTAPAGASSPSPASPSTQAQIDDWIRHAPPLGLSDDEGDGVISTIPSRGGLHGEAGAFVSNRGYGGYVAATAPVGKDALVGVAVQDTQFRGRFFHGDSRSLAASLLIGPQAAGRPANCPGGVQIGDRYVEPLWASHLRGGPLSDDAEGCFAPQPTAR
jgi:hypothetical protein